MHTRRVFLRNSALAMVGAGSTPLWLERALCAAGGPSPRKKILVAIFQRGAADGLNIVVPHGEKAYYDLRPTIAVPRPSGSDRENTAIDLDGFFGLHPSLVPLKPLFDRGHLAIVDAAGSPDPTRSHFDAQDYMESGTPGLKATTSGWMNRALLPEGGEISPVRAVSLGPELPRSMRGERSAIAVQTLGDFQIRDPKAASEFERLYTMQSSQAALAACSRDTFAAVSILQSIQKRPYTPAAGAQYPRGRFGESLRQIAQLIKADVGLELAFTDVGGWDHHVNELGQRASEGQLANLLREYGQALAAFWQDMGDRMADVAMVTMSEFGRTAHENGNRGTDHGHANYMFVIGGSVRGGRIHGRWPGLGQEQLYEGRDLALTTDFRDVLGELLARHLGNPSLRTVFPGYEPKFLGLI